MAENVKVIVSAIGSSNTDYTDPHTKFTPANYTTTPEMSQTSKFLADTAGTAIDLAPYAATGSLQFCLKNTDATNFVTVVWEDTATTGDATESARVPAGAIIMLPSVDGSTDITVTADTADCLCEYWLSGDAAA